MQAKEDLKRYLDQTKVPPEEANQLLALKGGGEGQSSGGFEPTSDQTP